MQSSPSLIMSSSLFSGGAWWSTIWENSIAKEQKPLLISFTLKHSNMTTEHFREASVVCTVCWVLGQTLLTTNKSIITLCIIIYHLLWSRLLPSSSILKWHLLVKIKLKTLTLDLSVFNQLTVVDLSCLFQTPLHQLLHILWRNRGSDVFHQNLKQHKYLI